MNRKAKRAYRAGHGGRLPYLFFRDGHFYPIELSSDEEARVHAEHNPGTTRVEDIDGNVVWPLIH